MTKVSFVDLNYSNPDISFLALVSRIDSLIRASQRLRLTTSCISTVETMGKH
jgi:hypothetical protein